MRDHPGPDHLLSDGLDIGFSVRVGHSELEALHVDAGDPLEHLLHFLGVGAFAGEKARGLLEHRRVDGDIDRLLAFSASLSRWSSCSLAPCADAAHGMSSATKKNAAVNSCSWVHIGSSPLPWLVPPKSSRLRSGERARRHAPFARSAPAVSRACRCCVHVVGRAEGKYHRRGDGRDMRGQRPLVGDIRTGLARRHSSTALCRRIPLADPCVSAPDEGRAQDSYTWPLSSSLRRSASIERRRWLFTVFTGMSVIAAISDRSRSS